MNTCPCTCEMQFVMCNFTKCKMRLQYLNSPPTPLSHSLFSFSPPSTILQQTVFTWIQILVNVCINCFGLLLSIDMPEFRLFPFGDEVGDDHIGTRQDDFTSIIFTPPFGIPFGPTMFYNLYVSTNKCSGYVLIVLDLIGFMFSLYLLFNSQIV